MCVLSFYLPQVCSNLIVQTNPWPSLLSRARNRARYSKPMASGTMNPLSRMESQQCGVSCPERVSLMFVNQSENSMVCFYAQHEYSVHINGHCVVVVDDNVWVSEHTKIDRVLHIGRCSRSLTSKLFVGWTLASVTQKEEINLLLGI